MATASKNSVLTVNASVTMATKTNPSAVVLVVVQLAQIIAKSSSSNLVNFFQSAQCTKIEFLSKFWYNIFRGERNEQGNNYHYQLRRLS
jgi:hypothetical protein